MKKSDRFSWYCLKCLCFSVLAGLAVVLFVAAPAVAEQLVKISAGVNHSAAIRSDGTVWVWGECYVGDRKGQTTNLIPVQVPGLSNVIDISVGERFTLALKSDHTVWIWGQNERGGGSLPYNERPGMGNGEFVCDPPVQLQIQLYSSGYIKDIEAGYRHGLALDTMGYVYGWGDNTGYQLGDDRSISRPTLIVGFGSNNEEIAAGKWHNLVRRNDGGVMGCGANTQAGWIYETSTGAYSSDSQETIYRPTELVRSGYLGDGCINQYSSGWRQYRASRISAGSRRSYIYDNDIGMLSLGDGDKYKCNTNFYWGRYWDNYRNMPTNGRPYRIDLALSNYSISAGSNFLIGIENKRPYRIIGWGANNRGQLGIGQISYDEVSCNSPAYVYGTSSDAPEFVELSAGHEYALALKKDGSIWAWGDNQYGQLGNGKKSEYETIPVMVLFGKVNVETPAVADGILNSGATGVLLYRMSMSLELMDAALTGITLRTGGTHLASDISKYKLYYSQDDTLDSGDTLLGEKTGVNSGTDLRFTGFSKAIAKGGAGYVFLTTDLSSTAAGTRTLFIQTPPLSNINFSPELSKIGTPVKGGTQAFEAASAVITSLPISGDIAKQGNTNHPLYGLKLEVSKKDVTLTGLNVKTAGNYQLSDVSKFYLRYSADATLDKNDVKLAEYAAVASGGTISFTGFTQKLPAGTSGYLFVTADIGTAVGVGRTISITSLKFSDILFEIDPQKIGTDPTMTGVVNTLYAVPVVAIATPAIAAAKVAQGTDNHVIYQMNLSVADNNTALTKVILVPKGFYIPSDIDNFKLYASADATFSVGTDILLAQAEAPESGTNLTFTNFSNPITQISKGGSLYLFVTIDVNENAVSIHNVYIDALIPDNLIFTQEDAVRQDKGILTGGAQTFPISPYIDMAAGFYHTIALKKNGTVWAWGNNESGQIGDGTTEDSVIALPVLGLTNIKKLAAGDFFSLGLKNDGNVWSWGQNDFGQLGDGTSEDRNQPVQVSGLTNVIGISAGDAHSVALRNDGTVWTWGENRYGQLGDGTTGDSLTPLRVSKLSNVIAVAAGGGWTMALKSDGTVWSWGQNDAGQLGSNNTVSRNIPGQISGLSGITAIAAGDYHGLALKSNTVFAWGNNEKGQIGDGTTTNRLTPVQVSGLTTVTAIDAGNRHSIVRLSDGTARTWGWNAYGQLGNNTLTDSKTPVSVTNLSGVVSVSAGGDFSLALKTDGTIMAWGHNRYGQFGDGTLTDGKVPVLGGVIPIIQVAAIDTPAAVAPRSAVSHVLYQLKLDVSDADATLTGLTLITGGDYEISDIAEQGFTLRYSADNLLDKTDTDKDPVLGVYQVVPPSGEIRFSDFSQLIKKGTVGYLFVTVNVGENPVGKRTIFIKETMLQQMKFAEKNVYKSGNEPLPAGGKQTFPIITVNIEVPAVSSANTQQNTQNMVLYRLNLSKTGGQEDAILTGFTVTTRGTYLLSDIVNYKLRYSADATLDSNDIILGIKEPMLPGETIEFKDLTQPISAQTGYIFVTADISATAGGARTVSIDGTQFADIQFAQTFLDKTGTDHAGAGGTMTFPMSKITATGGLNAGSVEQSMTDHPLYRIKLVTTDADTILTQITLTVDGTYEISDIQEFRVRFSENETLNVDEDPVLAEHDAVSRGESLVFKGFSQNIRKGTNYIFLTADIGDYAVARNIYAAETMIDTLLFADDVSFEPSSVVSMAAGGVQTFPTPKVAVSSSAVPAVTVEQDAEDHLLYKIKLDVSSARAVLTGIFFTTAGTYQLIDINQFSLRYSDDENLDEQDTELGIYSVILPGKKIVFEGLSQTIEKGASGYLFLTVDIGAANGARTINITSTPLTNLSFQEPENIIVSGTDPMIIGAVQTFPIPLIAIASPAVPAAEIEQDVPNLILFKVSLSPTRAEAVLTGATFATQGTYIAKDLAAENPFRLRYSEDDTLNNADPTLGTKPFINPGQSLIFSGLSRYIAKGSTGYLFLTVDIARANGKRTINIQGTKFNQLLFEFGDKVGTDPMAAGGVQTFPIPLIQIAAPTIAPTEVVQDTPSHILYRLNLSITRAEAVLKSLTLKTAGTYLPSDLKPDKPFKLRYSDNEILNSGDKTLSSVGFIGANNDLTFSGISHEIDKGITGYLFVTADIGPAVGRHMFISEMPFEKIVFEFGDKVGDNNPTLAGGKQQFPVPNIAITSPSVVSATVEPGTIDCHLYRLNLGVTKADAILESLTFTTAGTYRSSDIRTNCAGMKTCTPAVEQSLPVFKLWYSQDNLFGNGDTAISEKTYVKPGSVLAFTGLSQTVPKGTTGYLFITVNIGTSVGGRTINISQTPFDNILFGYREKTAADPPVVKTGTSPLIAGSVQTFAKTMGNLVEMDGIQDYLDIPYSAELNPSKFTVSVRASVSRKEDADGKIIITRQTIVSSINEEKFQGYEIFVDTDNKLKFRIGTGSEWKILEGPEVITHQFYNITGTYNGTGMSLFVNGQAFGENISAIFNPNNSESLRIGSQPDDDDLFDGQISDLHIWNIPRTSDDIKAGVTPTDEESGIVAHYRFMPWGTLVDTTGSDYDGTIFGDPAWASVLSGLWIGQLEIGQVNEVGYGSADTDTTRNVANPFDIRILLHLDGGEKLRLLRHVTLMQKQYSVEKKDGTTEDMVRRILVTDDKQLYKYEGIVRRDGKMVGIRLGTLFFDFDQSLNALPLNGKVRNGSSLGGDVSLSADHPHNPFRHLYHPDHRSGRDVARNFTMTVDEGADVNNPNAVISELKGVYEETIKGLHKIPIKMKGTFKLDRVSTIAVLNDEE